MTCKTTIRWVKILWNVMEICSEWVNLAEDSDHWRALVNIG